MKVSVVIPVKDDARVLAAVQSVLSARLDGAPPEVIVVNNGSCEAFEQTLAALPDRVILLHETDANAYRARNLGVLASSGDVVLLTDADCLAEPGWIEAALEAIEGGAGIVQGFSRSAETSLVGRLIQARYEAHLRVLPAGAPVECDTRNLAVRRPVFERVSFNEDFRRVGDTEFGLRAEGAGFAVTYAPAMRVAHWHDEHLDQFVAKQVCHGWGAQRLMRAAPDLPWHGRDLKLASTWGPRLGRIPGMRLAGRGLAAVSIAMAPILERIAGMMPFQLAVALLGGLDKAAGLAGHLMYEPRGVEPSPSVLLGRRLPRD